MSKSKLKKTRMHVPPSNMSKRIDLRDVSRGESGREIYGAFSR